MIRASQLKRAVDMKRYTILGVRAGEKEEREIAQCDSNPEAIVLAAEQQTVMLNTADSPRRFSERKWRSLRIVDNVAADEAGDHSQPPWTPNGG